MLPVAQKYAFAVFALLTLVWGAYGFYRLYRRVRRGQSDPERRFNQPLRRLWYAITTSLTQARTFRKRGIVSTFHAFIFYGFVAYILVNIVDAAEGYWDFHISSRTPAGATYNLCADILSFLVLVGVIALVIRRFALPARRDFRFNARTLLHPEVKRGYISVDSLIVSAFILFHVGSRALGAGARLAQQGPDKFQPFASWIAQWISPDHAYAWRLFGYWGALGSVLLFLAYFPYTKHVHIFMAPLKYFFARQEPSGVLPPAKIDLESEDPHIGANRLEDLTWPRLLDAYACIQCNRCQDVCPATATGKSLSPAALEINKRMELNGLAWKHEGFGTGTPSPHSLLQFALTPEAAWACTTCGACMQVCPVQDEQMLDLIDIRRHQVLIEGDFPQQLQTAFRGMERAKNPWGISHDKRMDWAAGLNVPTTDELPDPDVLYWVGCAASYDPQAQKTARAVVQLLAYAGIKFAVLGKRECCTGDSARRAGNELLYTQLANENIQTLNTVRPKLVLASCPHCMNAIGKEYPQLGGNYRVMHHTQYLALLQADGKLQGDRLDRTITYHDPCYLGRHNGVFDDPRELLRQAGAEFVELDRRRENAFCCGAGGAQFWKEEEPGDQRVSENRFAEVKQRLDGARNEKTLAVACPFCRSMLGSTPGQSAEGGIAIQDLAEILLESVEKKRGVVAHIEAPATATVVASAVKAPTAQPVASVEPVFSVPLAVSPAATEILPAPETADSSATIEPSRKKWTPKKPAEARASATPPPAAVAPDAAPPLTAEPQAHAAAVVERKKWTPRQPAATPPAPTPPAPTPPAPGPAGTSAASVSVPVESPVDPAPSTPATPAPPRKKWQPKSST
jgi:Fe-S oxidoreductase